MATTTTATDTAKTDNSDELTTDLAHADELWRHAESQDPADHQPVYNCLKELDTKYADNVHIKWRLARACKDLSETASLARKQQQVYAYQGKDVATAAVALDPTVWQAHMFRGALLGVCSRFELWNKLASAREMKDCFTKAVEVANNTSPEPFHSLGQAEFGFCQAGRAARLLGLVGSYESALELFEKAEALCPHECYNNTGGYYHRNWLMMVQTLKALGQKEKAREWLDKLLQADVVTPDDRAALAEAKAIKL